MHDSNHNRTGHAHHAAITRLDDRQPLTPGTVYTCPMHPEVRQDRPGACPMCGMALEPVTAASVQASSDGTLFWVIANGIMATGMPAFGPTHSDEELWTLVTFLRHLPQLSPGERGHLLSAQSGSHQAGYTHNHAEHTH